MIQISVQVHPSEATRFHDANLDDYLLECTQLWLQEQTSGPVPNVQVRKFEGVTLTDALRYVSDQAQFCRVRREHEALCIMIPSLVRVLGLDRMNGYEAEAFRRRLREALAFHSLSDPREVGA
jgi:hypothetical protein